MKQTDELCVWVLGGAGDIGTSLCKELQTRGHHVVVWDIRPPSVDADWVEVDLREREQLASKVTEVSAELNAAHSVVNVAGIYRVRSMDEFEWSEFDEYMSVNLHGPLALALAWEASSRALSSRRLINVSSAGALRGSRDLAYAASKAALIGATRSLARSFAERDVTVLCVSPGLIDTQMSQQMSTSRQVETVNSTIARRAGDPTELAAFLSFLATESTSYLTGAMLPFDGGLT